MWATVRISGRTVFHGVVVIIDIGNWGGILGNLCSSTHEHRMTVFGQLSCLYMMSSSSGGSNGKLLSVYLFCHSLPVTNFIPNLKQATLKDEILSMLIPLHSMLILVHSMLIPIHSMLLQVYSMLIPIHSMLIPIHSMLLQVHSMLIPIHSMLIPIHSMLIPIHSMLIPIYVVAKAVKVPSKYCDDGIQFIH